MSAFVMDAKAARGSGSVIDVIVPGSPGRTVRRTLPQDGRNATNDSGRPAAPPILLSAERPVPGPD